MLVALRNGRRTILFDLDTRRFYPASISFAAAMRFCLAILLSAFRRYRYSLFDEVAGLALVGVSPVPQTAGAPKYFFGF